MRNYGITYPLPGFLTKPWFLKIWKKYMCSRGYHLLDECDTVDESVLFCDACDLEVVMGKVYKWNHETQHNDEL